MCVTISGLYALTVIVDKRAVNSDNKDMFVVIHMIYNPQSIHLARFGMWCYDLECCEKIAQPKPCLRLLCV